MMHVSENYGYLGSKGRAYPPETIARYVGASSLDEYLTLLAELDSAGVPRRNSDGIIYSKRMVEDERKRKKWRKSKQEYRLYGNDVQGVVSPMSAPSSSSSSSTNQSQSQKPPATPAFVTSKPLRTEAEQRQIVEARDTRLFREQSVQKEVYIGFGPSGEVRVKPEALARAKARGCQ